MTNSQLNTPIIFFIFNRPETTEKVFGRIRQAKPCQLLVVADGPRKDRNLDIDNCDATRSIIDKVDWECEVYKNYSLENLGCKQRVSSGLDWAFEIVDSAIILEDDCLPDPTFFRFCEELLTYYRFDNRIMAISGNNFQCDHKRTNYSYYFSKYNHCWGWATWARAWEHYDIEMTLWPMIKQGKWLKDILRNKQAIEYWNFCFQAAYENSIDSWAYRWTLACWLQNGITILPNQNLVSNIGFMENATHTSKHYDLACIPTEPSQFPLRHPPLVICDSMADKITETKMFRLGLRNRLKKYVHWFNDLN